MRLNQVSEEDVPKLVDSVACMRGRRMGAHLRLPVKSSKSTLCQPSGAVQLQVPKSVSLVLAVIEIPGHCIGVYVLLYVTVEAQQQR